MILQNGPPGLAKFPQRDFIQKEATTKFTDNRTLTQQAVM